MNTVYESMTVLRTAKYRIRVWRDEPTYTMGPSIKVLESFKKFLVKHFKAQENPALIVDWLQQDTDISAIEILNNEGDGIIVYPDWK